MKKILSIMSLVFMLLVSSISINVKGEEVDNKLEGRNQNVTKLEIRPATDDGKNKPIFSKGQVYYYLHVASSQTQLDSQSMKVKITIPRELGNIAKVSDAGGGSIKANIKYTKENIEITFTTTNLVGGTEISVPFDFTTHKNGLYSNKEIKEFKAELFSVDDELIAGTKGEVEFKTVEYDTNFLMLQNNDSWLPVNINDHKAKTVGGALNDLDPSVLTDDLDRLESVGFKYRFKGRGVSAHNDSARLYEDFKITMEMPEGVVFDETLEANKGWVQEGNNLVYAPEENVMIGPWEILTGVEAKFPGKKLGVDYKIKVHVSGVPVNMNPDTEKVLDTKFDINLSFIAAKTNVESKLSYRLAFYDSLTHRRDRAFNYVLSIMNESVYDNLNEFTFTSHDLDDRFYISKIEFMKNVEDVKGTFKLYTMSNGVETLYDDNMAYENQMIEFDSHVDSIRVEANDDMVVSPKGKFSVDLFTKVTDYETPLVDPNETDEAVINEQKKIYNHMSFEARIGDKTFKRDRRVQTPYKTFNTSAGVSVQPYSMLPETIYMNHRLDLRVGFSVSDLDVGTMIDYTDLVVLLPQGYRLYNDTGTVYIEEGIKDIVQNEIPIIEYDYKGSGKDALIWKLNPFVSEGLYSNTDNSTLLHLGKIHVSVVPSMYVENGEQEIEARLAWNNTDEVANGNYTLNTGGPIEDDLDINDNHDVDEMISSSRLNFKYTAPRELIYSKTVKGSLDSSFQPVHEHGFGEMGEDLEYKV